MPFKDNMNRTAVQIYEIQEPQEAEKLIELGVDRLGSVILENEDWKIPSIRETIRKTEGTSVKSSLIPLFNTPGTIFRVIEYYKPDIIHFCETLTNEYGEKIVYHDLIDLQSAIKEKFPAIEIMRSVPIAVTGKGDRVPTLEIAGDFEPSSDYFLTDTWLGKEPVEGFIGITGRTCDWNVAQKLVSSSLIPVFLAGGISPENVHEAIGSVDPFGVDSCTNTNAVDSNGIPIRFKKDLGKVARLIDGTRRADLNRPML